MYRYVKPSSLAYLPDFLIRQCLLFIILWLLQLHNTHDVCARLGGSYREMAVAFAGSKWR